MDKSKLKTINIDDSFTLGANNHSFNVSLATKIGLIEAILLQNFYHWHCSNKENKEMIKDGRVWFFRSVARIAEEYAYLSADKIRNAIERLAASGLLIKGNYSDDKFSKVNWYSLSDVTLSIMEGTKVACTEITEPFGKLPNHSVNYQQSYNKLSYNNNNKETEKDKSFSTKKVDENGWRQDYAVYQQIVEDARSVLKNDDAFYRQMFKFYPQADYDLTIDKAVETFWITEAGWAHKKKSRTKTIDMLATLKRNYAKNIVYLQRGQTGRPNRPADSQNKADFSDKLVINGVEYQ